MVTQKQMKVTDKLRECQSDKGEEGQKSRNVADLISECSLTKWFVTDYADLYHVHTGHDHLLSTDMVRVSIDRSVEFATMVAADNGH